MSKQMENIDHDRIDLLLPWYVNGSLDSAENSIVHDHVAECAQCRDSIALLEVVQAEVGKSATIPIVPRPRVAELLESIDHRTTTPGQGKRHWKIAIAASVLVASVVVALLLAGRSDITEPPARFETATSRLADRSMDYVLGLQFDPAIGQDSRERTLRSINALDASAVDETGLYRIVVRLPITSLEELQRYTESLESSPAIRSVSIIALQLPITEGQ